MDARTTRPLVLLLALSSLGAHYGLSPAAPLGRYRSPNFDVTAETTQFARQVCEAGERYRHDLAVEWLGRPLPPWESPCAMRVVAGPQLGAGGATSFAFDRGRPVDFRMTIQGTHDRILDSVLPHEVTHMIMATHFGQKLPRWADEGAATMIEHVSERSKHDKLLIRFLTTEKGIPFNEMFALEEYPDDILPLYSQGYSVARFLVAQGGKRRFVQYIGDGLRYRNWTAATQKHYGFASLSELQLGWLDWVRQGSPETVPGPRTPATAIADSRPAAPAEPNLLADAGAFDGLVPLPTSVYERARLSRPTGSEPAREVTTPVSAPGESWYCRPPRSAQSPVPGARLSRAEGRPPVHQLAHPKLLGRPDSGTLQWDRATAETRLR